MAVDLGVEVVDQGAQIGLQQRGHATGPAARPPRSSRRTAAVPGSAGTGRRGSCRYFGWRISKKTLTNLSTGPVSCRSQIQAGRHGLPNVVILRQASPGKSQNAVFSGRSPGTGERETLHGSRVGREKKLRSRCHIGKIQWMKIGIDRSLFCRVAYARTYPWRLSSSRHGWPSCRGISFRGKVLSWLFLAR